MCHTQHRTREDTGRPAGGSADHHSHAVAVFHGGHRPRNGGIHHAHVEELVVLHVLLNRSSGGRQNTLHVHFMLQSLQGAVFHDVDDVLDLAINLFTTHTATGLFIYDSQFGEVFAFLFGQCQHFLCTAERHGGMAVRKYCQNGLKLEHVRYTLQSLDLL